MARGREKSESSYDNVEWVFPEVFMLCEIPGKNFFSGRDSHSTPRRFTPQAHCDARFQALARHLSQNTKNENKYLAQNGAIKIIGYRKVKNWIYKRKKGLKN